MTQIDEFNRSLEDFFATAKSPMEVGVERVREARERGRSAFGSFEVDPDAIDEVWDGVPVHILEPPGDPSGVYLHIHGGGWVTGAAHHHDRVNRQICNDAGVVVVSVEYRLAPEHPFPTNLEDCLSVARRLVDTAPARWGTDRLVIGGESAGAHLSALTLLAEPPIPFSRALFSYGVFDVARTPSSRRWGDRYLVLSGPMMEWCTDLTFPGEPDLRRATISPLYADLEGMIPARFVVGTLDPLLDDTLFMAARWEAAGNDTELVVLSGAVHAFDYFPEHPLTADTIAGNAAWLAG